MKKFVTGAVLLVGLAFAVPANGAEGQCSVTGFGDFACDLTVDGGGITFALPDGRSFVFAHVSDGEGLGYISVADPRPGNYPEELGAFAPVEGEDGCWFGAKDGITFCAAFLQ